MDWLNQLLTGTLASVIAVIAVASVGLLLISGRLDLRRSVQVILGCFVIFGASTIASGIHKSLADFGAADRPVLRAPPTVYAAPPMAPQSPNPPFDPYARAALPPRQ